MSSDKMDKINHISKYQKYKSTYTTYHNCECGGRYTLNSKHNHLKSKKHQQYLTIMNEKDKEIQELKNKLNVIKENLI
ncbi:hypothetical protein Klosneuvirus_12_5 [Klosneuvirus KNV1]|uniref:Uncharacterized protein n=1 Tax=Klosneuvirus KNV1 TaxID=1977640 RepID=A0A1V0SLZ6_9VIRU|nr:hypothetical protein Klosneuvirus_12_5 [Klosneuvirus KNV1]